jgi:NADH-quinone oxidoreductase subunit H
MTPNIRPSQLPRRASRGRVLFAIAIGVGLPSILFAAVLVLTVVTKPAIVEAFVRDVLGQDPAAWPLTPLVHGVGIAILALIVLAFAVVVASLTIWWEMRVSSRMQSRIGYNRAGAGGFFQWLADGVKLIFKEDLVPEDSDKLLFRAAPYFVFAGFGLVFVALPFGESAIVADMNIGVFYVIAITALVVVGILLAGWSSNSKWALFGGMRSAAQVISYEIPAGIALMVPILMAGTLSMQGIIRAQGAWPWQWFVFTNPFATLAFVIFFTAQIAESNRPPFDLPEAESELVAGYLSEYSSFRYAIYFLVEFGNVWVMSAIAVTLFFGGWQIPFVGPETYASARGAGDLPGASWWALEALSMMVFSAKTFIVMNVVIWIRWTFPRIRIDQMMNLCWKYLVPGAFLAFVATLLWQILVAREPRAADASGIVLTVVAAVVTALFVRQTRANISAAGDRVDLTNW